MAGVKGRSGRPSNANEKLRLGVIDQAWLVLKEAFEDPNLDPREKRELAAKIAVKSIPTELSGDIGVGVTAMGTITRSTASGLSESMEFKIGGKLNSPKDPEHSDEAAADNNAV